MRGAGGHADAGVNGVERGMKIRNRLNRVRERRQQCRSPFEIVAVGQPPSQFPLDLGRRVMRRSPQKPPVDFFGGDRIAVAGEHVGVNAARNDFAVDQDTVAVENDEIKVGVLALMRFVHANRDLLRIKTPRYSGFVVVQRDAI